MVVAGIVTTDDKSKNVMRNNNHTLQNESILYFY